MDDALRMPGVSQRTVRLAIAVLAVFASTCGRAPVQTLDPAKVAALREELERTSPEATPRPLPSPRRPAKPAARSAKQQRARAQAVLPPGRSIVALSPIGRDGRQAFVLDVARGQQPGRESTLSLVDLASDPAVLLAAHDFGETSFLPGGPVRIAATFQVRDETAHSILLADLRSRDGSAAVCGWWLSSDRPRLVCLPAMPRPSELSAWSDMLIQTWDAGSPTPPVRAPGINGRVLVFGGGGWRELDSFRCLGWKLDRALREANQQPLGEWQRGATQARRAAALAAAERGDARAARALLGDALDLDACDIETWRIAGRLDLQAGDAAAAVPALAVAVALRPHGEAALVDLADALIALDQAGGGEGEAWSSARQVLSSRKGTKALVEQAKGPRPSDLARVLYERFLAMTAGSAPHLGAQRRHAREQIERSRAAVNPGSPAPSPTAAR